MPRINMLDLHAEFALMADDARKAIESILTTQQFIGGPAIGELEKTIADVCGVSSATAVSSGTDSLICAMMALEIGHGDEVILPAFTFFATAGAVSRLGARPVFVDIDPATFTITPEAIEKAITPKTKAILVVHLFGQCAEMDEINAIAKKHNLFVVEDAAQAIGAKYHDRPACSLGDIACLSFYPTKNLGGFGEGGMVLTDNEKLGQLTRQLRVHGESGRYIHERVGGNFRLDTMKAALLLVKYKHWPAFTQRRREIGAFYTEQFMNTPVTPPVVGAHQHMVYHQYSILADRRDDLRAYLGDRDIGSGIYYPVPLHLQKCFADCGYKPGDLPVTEETCTRVMSLPCHPMLTDDDIAEVAETVQAFYKG